VIGATLYSPDTIGHTMARNVRILARMHGAKYSRVGDPTCV
jgi:hypothetical protein